MANPIGHPLKFKTKEELEKKIQEYFDHCRPHIAERPVLQYMVREQRINPKTKKKVWIVRSPKRGESYNHVVEGKEKYITQEEPVTVTGLAVFLDTNRETLIRYQKKEQFYDTITRAKALIHAYAEKSLWQVKSVNGIIFNLKNNWEWKDQSEVKHTEIPTGFEELSDEELNQKLEQLRRKNAGGLPIDGSGKPKKESAA